MSVLIVYLIRSAPHANGGSVLTRGVLLQDQPLVPIVHRVVAGPSRGAQHRQIAAGTEGALLDQAHGQVEVRAMTMRT